MDIAQETFLKLFSCIRDFRGEASFESWLYRLVVNRCLDPKRGAAPTAWWVGFWTWCAPPSRGPAEVRSYLIPEMLRWLGGDENVPTVSWFSQLNGLAPGRWVCPPLPRRIHRLLLVAEKYR